MLGLLCPFLLWDAVDSGDIGVPLLNPAQYQISIYR